MAAKRAPPSRIHVGSRVRFTREFLRSIEAEDDGLENWRGTVTRIAGAQGERPALITVRWDGDRHVSRALESNLEIA
jgi:hypothetical protein